MYGFNSPKIAVSLVFLLLTAHSAYAQNSTRPRVSGTVEAKGARDSTNTISAGTYVNRYTPTARGSSSSGGSSASYSGGGGGGGDGVGGGPGGGDGPDGGGGGGGGGSGGGGAGGCGRD